MRANLTKKINAIDAFLKERKLIELALTQLNRAWGKLIENHKEFQSLSSDDKELLDADTWLLESQAIVEELICRTVEYQEDKIVNGESELSVPIETKKPELVLDQTDIASFTSVGRQSSKKGGSKTIKTTSFSSRERARAAAREADLAKLNVKQLMEIAELEAKIAAQKPQLDAQLAIKEAEQEADLKHKEALLLKEEVDEHNIVERLKDFEDDTSVAGKSEHNVKIEPTSQVKEEDIPKKGH